MRTGSALVIGILACCFVTASNKSDRKNPSKQIFSDSPRSFMYTSYQLGPVCVSSEPIRVPTSVDHVIGIVEEAIRKRRKVKAFGSRHSISDIICTNGIPIDMRGIQGIQYNAQKKTVTVGAGVYVRDLCEFLKDFGRGLRTLPSYGLITVGGAIGTGAHGSSIKHKPSLSEHVLGVTVVDGTARLRYINSEDDLRAFRVHLGLLGIVVSVTMETEPLYKVLANNYVESDEILTDRRVFNMARNADQMSIYWFPSLGKVVIANWTIVDVRTPGEAFTFDHVPSNSAISNWLTTSGLELSQQLDSALLLNVLQGISKETLVKKVPFSVPIYTEDGFNVLNPAVGYYHLMFAPICNTSGWLECPWHHGLNGLRFLDNEINIPLTSLASFVRLSRGIISQSPAAFPIIGILLRFTGPSTSYMSTSYGRENVHVEWYMSKRFNPYEDPSTGLAAYQAMLQTMAKRLEGRSHWGKSGLYYHSAEVLRNKINSKAREQFLKKMKQFDPYEIFSNDFGLRLKGLSNKINIDPLTRHCALLDNCVCSKSTDCAVGQTCSQIYGLPVCLTQSIFPSVELSPISTTSISDWFKSIFQLFQRST